jgi:hypothetical protein
VEGRSGPASLLSKRILTCSAPPNAMPCFVPCQVRQGMLECWDSDSLAALVSTLFWSAFAAVAIAH